MRNLNQIKGSLNEADEKLQDLRAEMEWDIIDYMKVKGVTSLDMTVTHMSDRHHVVVNLGDVDGDEHLIFSDLREGWDGYSVYDMALPTDLIASVSMELSNI